MLYDKPNNNVSPKREEEILEFWKQDDTFKKSIKLREGAQKFVFLTVLLLLMVFPTLVTF